MTRCDFATTTYCLWCGALFRRSHKNRDQQCCGATHSRKMTERRAKIRNRAVPPAPCPNVAKLSFEVRGAAVRAAYVRHQHFYECRCGLFHLTSTPNEVSVTAIEILREKERRNVRPDAVV